MALDSILILFHVRTTHFEQARVIFQAKTQANILPEHLLRAPEAAGGEDGALDAVREGRLDLCAQHIVLVRHLKSSSSSLMWSTIVDFIKVEFEIHFWQPSLLSHGLLAGKSHMVQED